MAKRRKAVYVDNIYIEHGGAGGYQHVGGEGLLDSRFPTAGGAAKRVLKALRTVTAPDDASRVFFDVGTSTGAIFRVYVNCEGDEVTVSHQGHSDMANDFLDDVGRETGWPNVAVALNSLHRAVENGELHGAALEERVRTEVIPGLRQWRDCLRQRDEWDKSELDGVAKSIELATGLDTVTKEPEPSPLDAVIATMLRADDPVAAVLDEAVLMEIDYMDIPLAIDLQTGEYLEMAGLEGGEACKKT